MSQINTNPFDDIIKTVNENYGKIIKKIYNVKEDLPIFIDSYGQVKIRGGNGKTTVAKYVGGFRLGSESAEPLNNIELYTKVYRGINGNGKREEIDYMKRPQEPWKYEAEVYKLFKQSGLVPEAFLFEDIPGLEDKLITISAGDETLEQKIAKINYAHKELSDEELALQQLPLFLNVICTQAVFDNYAESILSDLVGGSKIISSKLMASKKVNVLNKSLNYLRAWLGKDRIDNIPEEIIALFNENYQPIAFRFEKNRNKLIHGALDGENIVGRGKGVWKAPDLKTGDLGNIRFIDLESLRFGHPFFDSSSIAITPGSYLGPKQWEDMIKYYNEKRIKLYGFEPEEKKSYALTRFLGELFKGESELKMNENSWKGMRSVFYAGIIHNALKIGAKLRDREKFFPESFEAMLQERPYLKNIHEHNRKFIALGIKTILENPENFVIEGPTFNKDAFTEEELGKLKDLSMLLISEGIIPSKDRCPMSLQAKYEKKETKSDEAKKEAV